MSYLDMPCSCGSEKSRSGELVDARGIFAGYYCPACERAKRAQFRPEIFTDADYETCEPIEED